MSPPNTRIEEKKLSNWKLLDAFRERLTAARKQTPTNQRANDPKRLLLEDDYFSLMFFGMLNPVVESMRGLCAISNIKRVQEDVCARPVSLGSFSEAQSVFDPELLKNVFLQLSKESSSSWGDPRLSHLKDKIKLVDGSLLPALPRMYWALWVDENNHAAKLHLKFNVLTQTACDAIITAGNTCERKTLRKFAQKGEIIVGDRYYGLHYAYLEALRDDGISSVMRIRNSPKMEVIEELPLGDADRSAGVTWQAMVKLGDKWRSKPIRVVRVEFEGKFILLATDLDLDAELIALIYKYRWQIELFFKWLKCILKCRHLVAESKQGVEIQIYCALIAALMLQDLVGKKPTKREMEFIQFYFIGFIEIDELIHLLKLRKKDKKA